MHLRRSALTASLLLGTAFSLHAQRDRIATRINPNQTVFLRGHVHSQARAEFDQGAVEPGFELPAITLFLRGSDAQQSGLQQLLGRQQDPTSPDYHNWLTPEEYADRFGVSQNDIEKIVAWLESQGFTVSQVSRARNWIVFSGTGQQALNALHTQIHRYQVGGAEHYANATDPAVPAALAGLVAGFRGLHDFRMKPRSKRHSAPESTTASGVHHLAPDDLSIIYNIDPLYKAGIDGAGQKVAVVGQTAIRTTDIEAFRNKFNLPAIDLQQVLVPGHPKPGVVQGDLGEADLDIEWSGAVARNATIVYVYSDDVMASLTHAVDQNLAPVITMSYGSCEPADLVDLPTIQSLARQANAQGITWLAAAGDAGAADCEDQGAAVAQNGLAVDSPASTPEVTGMGGLEFVDSGNAYWAGTNTANSASALSYIPEQVWNDTASDGSLSAGGGGASVYFARPVWQTGPGVPNDAFRHVPDLSLSASASHDGYYVYTGGSSAYYGGTSVAAPVMAGIIALLNQYLVSAGTQNKAGVGNINPTLYRLAQNSPGVFHDIVQGDNSVPCASGSPGCSLASYGYKAAPGYDEATGLGSPDAYKLIHEWSSQPPRSSAVAPAIDSNPVFQQPADASGNEWRFTLTLAEEAGIATTLTSFAIDGKPFDITATFGSASIPAGGSITSRNLGLASVAVPKSVTFDFAGVDASGQTWTQRYSVPFSGFQTRLTVDGVSNAASGEQAFAPGEIVSIFGTALGSMAQSAATLPLPKYMAGFEAQVNGVSAPLYYVSPNQVNVQIPYETGPGRATLTVGNPFENVNYNIQVSAAAPGIFASNGFVFPPFDSAHRGQTATLFITGEGQVRPTLATGSSPSSFISLARLPKPALPVSVTIGGFEATLPFAGIPSGLVGVTQINFEVPAGAPLGVQPVVVTVGTVSSPPVNITVLP